MLSFLRRVRSGGNSSVVGDAVILMYHSISTKTDDPWRLHVEASVFASHLEMICDRFRPVALQELCRCLAEGRVEARSVVVTFDDGYRDNVTVAKPLLAALGVPATVFVTTGYLGSGRDFWWEELEDVCARLDTSSGPLWERLRSLAPDVRETELDELWNLAGADRPSPHSVMADRDLKELAADDGIEIGAHTVNHPHLSVLSEAEQRNEIEGAKRRLEAILSRRITSFSYPHGDFSPVTKRLVRDAGLDLACTTRPGPITARSDPLELPRLQVVNCDAENLAAEIDRRLRARR